MIAVGGQNPEGESDNEEGAAEPSGSTSGSKSALQSFELIEDGPAAPADLEKEDAYGTGYNWAWLDSWASCVFIQSGKIHIAFHWRIA